MAQSPSPARVAAIDLILWVLQDGKPLSHAQPILEPLAPPDRAAAQRLALQTLRGLGPADALLKPRLRHEPPGRVRAILRLGVTELAAGAAAHGVVSDCVSLADGHKTSRGAKGMVNAVLRALAPTAAADWAAAPVTRLPAKMRKPLVKTWGNAAIRGIEAAHAGPVPVDLTARSDASALAKAVGGTVLPTGSVRIAAGTQISALPGYDDGAFWVQDAAAAVPVSLLGDITGLRVLDMCAAPGGKTLQLAARGAEVTALDIDKDRLARVRENLDRTGLKATLVAGDALTHTGTYDVVVVDAPCSATGTIRRHPDLPHVRDKQQIGDRAALQAQMIDHAMTLVAPGGRLVFATCSVLPAEGEKQIVAALERHPDWRVVAPDARGVSKDWRSPEGGLRLRPDFWAEQGGMDGFYMAVLQAPGASR